MLFPSYPELGPHQVGAEYDYIIVGGGTAGCVLASRLSEDPSISVLLLERGPVADTWSNRVPFISSSNRRKNAPVRIFDSLPIKEANNRKGVILTAHALGGASRVNAMLVTRGAPGDYNNWRDMGHPQWSYEKLQPYFIKSEKTYGHAKSDYRGSTGVWENKKFPSPTSGVLFHFQKAASAIGIPHLEDLNAPNAPSVGFADCDIAGTQNCQRVSTYSAFLPFAVASARRDRLHICTNTVVSRIDIEDGRAVGVYFEGAKKTLYARVRKEIIVSAGALGSPQILLLSGIGEATHLAEHGIKQVVDLPGVGKNLGDHLNVPVMYKNYLHDSFHQYAVNILSIVKEVFAYLFTGGGLLGLGLLQISLFARTTLMNPSCEFVNVEPKDLDSSIATQVPDTEIMPLQSWGSPDDPPYEIKHGVFSFLTAHLTPKSVGSVRLASNNPRDLPAVDLGYLTNPDDYKPIRDGIRLAIRMAKQMRANGYPLEEMRVPASESNEDLDEFIRENLQTSFHYTSTCRMAKKEDGGVVDDELRVYGVQGLRVCDTSIFPVVPATHTMAPVVAVAEKCADMIKSSKL